ncbi:hypothetical protein IB270_33190 [Ensifer sp. ENS05]|uniref:hypothetical protein n=1 Tax=Ensifer sp. ENS05 TaxID=2769277 RepID=UPI00177E3EB6|nr:hypothetical protein [Ensifer sp. ENS05]MBD9597681.1 hypothetical protein [Ensifer sp. ENS05]
MTADDVAYLEAALGRLPAINWSNIEEAVVASEQACRMIGDDKRLLELLIKRAGSDPKLFDMCECHDLDDKIVLYDDLEQGYRVRLRLAKDEQYERAHNHRFPFTAYILYGQYYQQWYRIEGEPAETTVPADVHLLAKRVEQTGSIFTISADAFHSTQTSPKTVSLMICGPAVRKKSFIINMDSGRVWGKSGRSSESKEEIEAYKMPRATFDAWVDFMASVGVI